MLSDQRRVRLIGLNTLELNSQYKPDQRFARIAKQRLEALIGGKPVSLALGREEFDRHGRTLAHLVLSDGSMAAHKLIQEGLALAVTVGANTRCFDALHRAEREARAAHRGIWQLPGKWWHDTKPLRNRDRGFKLMSSKVLAVEYRKHTPQLTLKNGLTVKFDKHWARMDESTKNLPNALVGKKIELRGWVGNSAGQPVMTLSHPANLKIIAN